MQRPDGNNVRNRYRLYVIQYGIHLSLWLVPEANQLQAACRQHLAPLEENIVQDQAAGPLAIDSRRSAK